MPRKRSAADGNRVRLAALQRCKARNAEGKRAYQRVLDAFVTAREAFDEPERSHQEGHWYTAVPFGWRTRPAARSGSRAAGPARPGAGTCSASTGWGASATRRGNEELQADLPELREGRPPALDPLQEVRRPDPGLTLMRMAECPRCRRPVRIRVLQAHFKMGVTDDTVEVNSRDAEVLHRCGRCGSRLPSVVAPSSGGPDGPSGSWPATHP